MQDDLGKFLAPAEKSSVSGTTALLINKLTEKHFQLDKALFEWIFFAFGNTQERTNEEFEGEETVALVEVVKEKSDQRPLFTGGQLEVLKELAEALNNPDTFPVVLAKLKSFADLMGNVQPSIAICFLLARIYQRGHATLLNADPIQALSYFKTLCEITKNINDAFAQACHEFALEQVKTAATKEQRPGAILYLVNYYFRNHDFNLMDQWAARMPEAYKANLEEWYHKNDVHLQRGMLEENATNIAVIVQEICSSLLEHVNDLNRQELVVSELVRRAERIKKDPLCAVPLLKTLMVMIKDQRYKDEIVSQLLDTFKLRSFFSQLGSDYPYSLKLAQVYLIIVGSNEKSTQKLKNLIEANDEDCVTALAQLMNEPLPDLLVEHPNFRIRLYDFAESTKRPTSEFK